MNDYDVTLRLELGRTAMEALALRVLEVVERRASHLALGPVVGGTEDPPVVELEFDVRAESVAAVHRQVSEVLEIIERELGPVRSAAVADRELVRS